MVFHYCVDDTETNIHLFTLFSIIHNYICIIQSFYIQSFVSGKYENKDFDVQLSKIGVFESII